MRYVRKQHNVINILLTLLREAAAWVTICVSVWVIAVVVDGL